MPDMFDGGLMGMFADPRTAGMLGMAQGLLSASGASRLPVTNGQALGMGLQGAQQGFGNAVQMQQNLMKMRAMQGLIGGDASQQTQAQQQAPTSLLGVPSNPTGGLLSPTLPQSVPQTASQDQQAQSPGASIYGKTPQQLFQQGMLMNMAGIQGGGELMKIAVDHDPNLAAMMPTDITKMGVQGGMSPADIRAANAAGVQKANYIAPVNARPGAILRDPITMRPMAFNPHIPEGGTPLFDASGNVVGINSIPGATGVVSSMSAARTAGEGSALPYAGVDAQGNPLPVTNRTAAATQQGATTPGQAAIVQTESGGNPNAVSPKGALGAWQVMPNTNANPGFGVTPARDNSPAELNRVGRDYYEAMNQRYGNPTLGAIAYNMGPGATDTWLRNGGQWEKLPQETRNYVGKVSTLTALNGMPQQSPQGRPQGAIYAAPPMGAESFAQGQVKQMQDRWGQLRDQNTSAQTVISQLQNISQLAPAAITGAEADRRAYANGLLSLVGLPSAENAKTATDLLDKYSNQIIAKLGQGGLGTDAARAIVSAGNPNSHMTVQAIKEAVRNLTGQYQMVQAKTGLLQQFANSNDAAGYTRAESQFDKNADPRIWEWQSIQDPAERQQFALKVSKQDPKFNQKIKTLEQLGAFQ